MTIYCPLCNRSSDEFRFIGNFCEPCIVEKLERKLPSDIRILTCRFCGRVKEARNTFAPLNNASLGKALKSGMKVDYYVKAKSHDTKNIEAVFMADVDGEKVSFRKTLPYKIYHETCQRCYRISSGYYEAVVQLRGNWERINNLITKLTRYIERRNGFVAKVEGVEGGKDVYTSDKLMTTEFFHDYDLKPKRSYRLYGMKKGKRVYRNTYSLRFE